MMITRLQVSALLLGAAVIWGVSLIFAGIDVKPEFFKPFSTVVGVVVLLISLADRWIWRWRWLHPWLFNMPDIRGTWRVVIRPTAPASSPNEVEGYMVIRQTLSSLRIRLYTAESESETLSAKVHCCDDGTFTVAGVYRNTSRLAVRDRSPLHHGSILLSVQGDPPESLAGEYWTDRLSQGELELTARTFTLAHSFDRARTLFGVGESSAA